MTRYHPMTGCGKDPTQPVWTRSMTRSRPMTGCGKDPTQPVWTRSMTRSRPTTARTHHPTRLAIALKRTRPSPLSYASVIYDRALVCGCSRCPRCIQEYERCSATCWLIS